MNTATATLHPSLSNKAVGGSSVQLPGARPVQPGFSLGKYREIIIAVAFFLIFDLGVLVLNFYTSFQIAEDAAAINLAGRQRMLSQRTTKAIYAAEDQIAQSGRAGDDGKELETALKLFDSSLKAFREGGTVAGGDGKPVQLEAVSTEKGKAAIAAAQAIWQPFQEKASMLLLAAPSSEQVRDAVSYARANNAQLLARMNDLTTALELEAAQRASQLRLVQTVGIVLALLNFVFILFKFIRSLRRADEAVEIAANENRDILASVREGLFLITPDLRVGTQIAQSSHALFGKPVHAGQTMSEILAPLVTPKVLHDAEDYLDMLFTPHVKEQLAQSINPLSDVQIQTTNRLGHAVQRHLSFGFNRTITDGVVSHLLVTVQDITQRKELEAALQSHKQGAQRELSMILRALETDAGTLSGFVERAEADMLLVNAELRQLSASTSMRETQALVDSAFRRVHAFKGEAQAMSLEILAMEAHRMEDFLQQLRGDNPSQEALLALPVLLESLLSKLTTFREMASRRLVHVQVREERHKAEEKSEEKTAFNTALEQTQRMKPVDRFAEQLTMLGNDVARDVGKSIAPQMDCSGIHALPQALQTSLQAIAIQLVRNAVVHGIEVPSQRIAHGKPVAGQLLVKFEQAGDAWQLLVRDDGAGISTARIRQRLVELAWFSEIQAQALDERQVMAQLFKPGFSTAMSDSASAMHAGRGVGLDLVQNQVKALGANLSLSSQPGKHCEWRVKFNGAAKAAA